MAFQVLLLSGGDFLGLYSIAILAALEEEVRGPIASRFDLISGTSVGGIIALGLAHEVPARDILKAFEANGSTIFSDRPAPRGAVGKYRDIWRSLWRPKYADGPLRRTVVDILGGDITLADLKHPCIVPAVNLTKGAPQVFKTDHHPDFKRDLTLRAVDVALATAAAPTYFPIAEVGSELFADGGLYANAPDLLALHEAEHFFGVQAADVAMPSIGTTTARFSFSHARGRNFGLLNWAAGQRLVSAMLSSQQLAVTYMLGHKLGKRYVRLDAQQSREQEQDLALDVATADAQRTIRGRPRARSARRSTGPNYGTSSPTKRLRPPSTTARFRRGRTPARSHDGHRRGAVLQRQRLREADPPPPDHPDRAAVRGAAGPVERARGPPPGGPARAL